MAMHTRVIRMVPPVLLLAAGLLVLSGCIFGGTTTVTGSGHVKSEQRKVSSFKQVTLSGVGQLTITQGTTDALTVKADANLLPYLTSSVSGTTLELGVKSGVSIQSTNPIAFLVTVTQLQGLTLSGSGGAKASNVSGASLTVTLSGSGDVVLNNVKVPSLTATLSGSGSIQTTGSAQSQDITISGSGDFNGRGFATKTAKVDISGSGSVAVQVSDALSATITGSGDISYLGSPKVTQHVTGSGSVSQQ
jgi:Putative auto-transporter adhesin, head GIN domain